MCVCVCLSVFLCVCVCVCVCGVLPLVTESLSASVDKLLFECESGSVSMADVLKQVADKVQALPDLSQAEVCACACACLRAPVRVCAGARVCLWERKLEQRLA